MRTRAIVGARVSVYDDEGQTSPTTQREAGERYASQHDMDIIGYFEDLDVSASISPWDRPDLGPWLKDKPGEWDAIIFAKVDRAFRSIKDCADVAHWAEQNHKILVFTEDGIVLNYKDDSDNFASMMAKVFLVLASMFAEMELKRIRNRFKDAHTYIRTRDRWKGGLPPYGYRIIDHPEGGKTLDIDPVAAESVRLMGQLILEQKSLWEVAGVLNAKQIPTPTTYGKALPGSQSRRKTETKGTWVQAQVGRIIRSQSCMGLKMMGRGANRKLIRGENGLPVRIADPLFTDEEWAGIQGALDKRTSTRERSSNAAPLLGLVYCLGCGERLYRSNTTANGTTYSYYRCVRNAEKPACRGYSFKPEELQSIIDGLVEFDLADKPRTRKVFVPGENHTKELEQVVKAMNDIRTEYDLGMYDYKNGEDEYRDRIKNLVAQRKILETLPQRSDTWIEEPTGETFSEAYFRMDEQDRRNLLLSAGVKLYCSPFEKKFESPPDFLERAQAYGHTLGEVAM